MLDFTHRGNARYYIVVCTVFSYVVAAPNCNSRLLSPQLGNQMLKFRRNLQPGKPADGPKVNRKRCCPYDFDSKFCRVVDDRLLCGYNKNVGEPISDNFFLQLSGGCRMRGDRLECGYEEGPFENPRRPPVWDNPPSREEIGIIEDDAGIISLEKSPELETLKAPIHLRPNKQKEVKEKHAGTGSPRLVTRCIETSDNRIVCKPI